MAGFAVVMEFLTLGFIGILVATIASIVLVLIARKRLPPETTGRRKFLTELGAAPFACLLWLPVALFLHAKISNDIAHQSVGYSPDPYVTLPNGYVVGSLNTYSGYVRSPGMPTDVPWVGPGYVRGLIDLSYSDGRFTGTYLDSQSDMQPQGTNRIRNFIFDTRDRSIKTSDTPITTDFGHAQDMIHQDATSYWILYASYRHQWPTVVFWLIFLVGEAVIVMFVRHRKPAQNI